MKKSLLGVACSLFMMLAAHVPAKADSGPVIFEDFVKFKGIGAGTPDLMATIENIFGGVRITMFAPTLLGSDKITEWYFNVIVGVGTLPTHVSGQTGTAMAALDDFKADGDGFFDIRFQFPTGGSNTFDPGDTSVWDIPFIGLDAHDFLAPSAPGGLAGVTFFSAVKLGNAYWAPGTVHDEPVDVTPIPEPSTLLLLGSGLLAGGVFRKRFQ